MIDTESETLFPLARGSREIQSRPSTATLWRWALRGVRGVTLESLVIGGRRYTSREAVARFTRNLNAPRAAAQSPEPARRTEEKKVAAKRASTTFS